MTAPTRNPFKRKRRLPSPEEVAVWIVLLIGAFTIGLGIGLDVGSPQLHSARRFVAERHGMIDTGYV